MTNPYRSVVVPQFILDSELLMRTYEFASVAHETRCIVNDDGSPMHLRKYGTGTAYIIHPIAVAQILWDHGIRNVKMLQTALLHDTVEDTSVTLEEIREKFGKRIMSMVDGLTDRETEGTRDERKAVCREWTSKQPVAVLTVKTADLIHNTIDITARDPDFAVEYTHEKALLLKAILKGGQSIKSDRSLYERAVQQLLDYHYDRTVDKFAVVWQARDYEQLANTPGAKDFAFEFYMAGIQRADTRYALVLDLAKRIKESE